MEVLNKFHFSLQMENCPILVADHSGLCCVSTFKDINCSKSFLNLLVVQTQFPLSGGIKGVKAYNTKKEKKYNVTSKPLCTFSTFWEKFPLEMTLEEQESAGGADIGRSIEKLR